MGHGLPVPTALVTTPLVVCQKMQECGILWYFMDYIFFVFSIKIFIGGKIDIVEPFSGQSSPFILAKTSKSQIYFDAPRCYTKGTLP